MANEFVIKNGFQSRGNGQVTGSLDVTGGITGSFTGSFTGDGSGLSGVPATAFPFVGDAVITGSLTISGSFSAFRVDSNNIVLGEGAALNMNSNADNNVILGTQTAGGTGTTSGDGNVAIGHQAGFNLSTGGNNVLVGLEAGKLLDNDSSNVFLGTYSGRYQKIAGTSISIGYNALRGGNSGGSTSTGNVAIGYRAGEVVNGAIYNNIMGFVAGVALSTGDYNTLIGYYAGSSITSGNGNIIIGSGSTGEAAISNQLRIGNGNTLTTISASLETGDIIFPSTASAAYFVGDGSNITGVISSSYAITASHALNAGGGSTFPFVGDAVITGSLIVSGSNLTSGFRTDTRNVILGYGAGNNQDATNGPYNVMIGFEAGYTNTIGDSNVCLGQYAGYALSTNASDENVFIGKLAGAGGTSPVARMSDANWNIGLGNESLLFLTSGDYNIGFGHRSLRNISSGQQNIALGRNAISSTNTGDNNIGIGYRAGNNQTTGDGNITIGSGSLGVAGESNQLRIGNGNTLTTISASLTTGDIIFASTASAEYFAGDGSQLTNLQRPISSSVSTDITASNSNAGFYFRVGGNVTCSIQTNAAVSCDIGSEFEFFQTSSIGNMLFLSSSGVTLNSKSGNITLTGQFSAATLKKVDTDEWDLIGDLS